MYKIKYEDLEHVTCCPACNAKNWKHVSLVKVEGDMVLRTSECMTCNLNYRTIRPNLDWFKKAWAERDQHQKSEQIDFLNPVIEKNRYDRYCFIYDELSLQKLGSNLIDIGAGTGGGTVRFQEKGYDCTVLEPDASRRLVAANTHSLKVDGRSIYDSIEDLGNFDICLLVHSLEHFHHPKEALDQVNKIMADDGLLYVEVPDYVESVKDWQDALYLAHISNFSEYNLVKIAEAAGFKAVKRCYPPVGKDGLNHLAMIFRKSPVVEFASPVAKIGKSIREVYCPEGNNSDVLTEFRIPKVNDISLCYKPDLTVLNSVRENYNTRSIRKIGDNVYEIN